MKNQFYAIVIILFITFSFSNCSKDDSKTIAGSMTAKVNGTIIVCDSNVFVRKDLSNKLWGVEGSKKGGNIFTFTFPVSNGIGTYQFLRMYNGTMCEAFYTKENNFNNQYHSQNGSITVTAKTDKNVKGTFSFKGTTYLSTDSVEITEGTFDIDY